MSRRSRHPKRRREESAKARAATRREAPGGSTGAGRARRGGAGGGRRSPAARNVAIVAIAVVVVLAGWFWSQRRASPPAPPELPARVLADSLTAARGRGAWTHGLDFARRLAAVEPRNSSVIRNLAVMIHNRAVAQSTRFGRPHPALRTSLDRVAAELQMLALLDSATALARTPDDWAQARLWYGQTHERLGLPLDAYQAYAAIRSRQPNYSPVAARMIWVGRLLKDPLTPDPQR